MNISPIAYIRTDFKEKFGIPRQSRRVGAAGKIEILKEFSNIDAFRGIENFSHLWLIFDFSENHRDEYSPTVRPPRMGGNTHIGVFASRAPFRPNNLGLSCVELVSVETGQKNNIILNVKGVDLLDKTPIYDIKPYIPYCDSIPEAKGSYAEIFKDYSLEVVYENDIFNGVSDETKNIIINCLSEDIRPSYQNDPERIYKWHFSDYDISFKVNKKTLTIINIGKIN